MIYFVRNTRTGQVKVGYSIRPAGRLVNLQTANPDALQMVALIVGDRADEARLHRQLADRGVGGEWFRLTADEIDDIIESEELRRRDRVHQPEFQFEADGPEPTTLEFRIIVQATVARARGA